jgi:mono/diheme cytochrome c family protein
VRILAGLLVSVVAVGMAGCKSVPPPTPLSELNAQQTHGHAVFQARCLACHYDRKDAPLNGPSMAGVFKKQYLPSGMPANDERVTATIVHGRNMMPAQGNTMDAQDLDDLLAYLHTL